MARDLVSSVPQKGSGTPFLRRIRRQRVGASVHSSKWNRSKFWVAQVGGHEVGTSYAGPTPSQASINVSHPGW
jgi:hypothetical protein